MLLNDEVRVVMESTGEYHYPIKKYAMIAICKGKTNPLNSIKIANYGIDYWSRLIDFKPTEEIYRQLKDLNRQYLTYLSTRVRAKQAMTRLL